MRRRWLAGFVVVAVAVATGLSAISVEAAITGVSVEAQAIPATGPETGVAVTTGPAGGGFDIRVQANVSSPSTWRSTRWTSGLNTGCINHTDRGPGTQTITFDYEFESNPVLRESPLRADPDNAGQSEHVFPDPPGGELSVQLFESNDCSGTAPGAGGAREREEGDRRREARDVGAEGRLALRRYGHGARCRSVVRLARAR